MRSDKKVLTLFGTRPEVIKLAPVIHSLERAFHTINVASAQHVDILQPFIRRFAIRVDYDLQVMEADQTPSAVCGRVLATLDPILVAERPALLIVQGDTTTAMAGALAAFHRSVPVGHVEAGLRSGRYDSPFPEEMNRRLISRLATYHFAATPRNRDTLLAEGVVAEKIFVTGNPVVDSLNAALERRSPTPLVEQLRHATAGLKRVVVTTHRRESFGERMSENLRVLRHFVDQFQDVALIFPVHPNPQVAAATAILSGHPRVRLIEPLSYDDFIGLLLHAWLIVSDSGGVQEEAPSLGKPLLILRDSTERPEVIEAGVARLVGGDPGRFAALLEEAHRAGSWVERVATVENPFGCGDSGQRITRIIAELL